MFHLRLVFKFDCMLESPRKLLKLWVPWPHPRSTKSQIWDGRRGWGRRVVGSRYSNCHSFLSDSNVQPSLSPLTLQMLWLLLVTAYKWAGNPILANKMENFGESFGERFLSPKETQKATRSIKTLRLKMPDGGRQSY